jgi:uncharacterized membrane protein YraQ (UPF0718 family)
MNQMDDLIKAINATFGLTFTIVIIFFAIIYAIFIALLPFIYWSIYNRTTKAIEELNGLKQMIKNSKLQQTPKGRLKKRTSENRQFEEKLKVSQTETLLKNRLPEPDYEIRKISHEKKDDSSDNEQSVETLEEGQIKPFPIHQPN